MYAIISFEELVELIDRYPDKTSLEVVALNRALEKDIWFSEEYEMTRELKNLMDAMEYQPSEKTLQNILDFSSYTRRKSEKLNRYLKVIVN